MSKPTKIQMAVLFAAAERADHVIRRPQQLDERSAIALGTALLKRGLVAEVQVKHKQSAWRTR